MAGNGSKAAERSKRAGWGKKGPQSSKAQPLKGVGHKE